METIHGFQVGTPVIIHNHITGVVRSYHDWNRNRIDHGMSPMHEEIWVPIQLDTGGYNGWRPEAIERVSNPAVTSPTVQRCVECSSAWVQESGTPEMLCEVCRA